MKLTYNQWQSGAIGKYGQQIDNIVESKGGKRKQTSVDDLAYPSRVLGQNLSFGLLLSWCVSAARAISVNTPVVPYRIGSGMTVIFTPVL